MSHSPQLQFGDVRMDSGTRRALIRRARRAAQRLGIEPEMRATLCIRIVDDAEMAKLHEEHLSQPGPTDVLSFPADDDDHLGDVAIDWDAVVRQATSQTSQALLDEATVLLVHGLAHLMGHDHGTREQARRMHRLEQRALRVLGVPDVTRPYGVDR